MEIPYEIIAAQLQPHCRNSRDSIASGINHHVPFLDRWVSCTPNWIWHICSNHGMVVDVELLLLRSSVPSQSACRPCTPLFSLSLQTTSLHMNPSTSTCCLTYHFPGRPWLSKALPLTRFPCWAPVICGTLHEPLTAARILWFQQCSSSSSHSTGSGS